MRRSGAALCVVALLCAVAACAEAPALVTIAEGVIQHRHVHGDRWPVAVLLDGGSLLVDAGEAASGLEEVLGGVPVRWRLETGDRATGGGAPPGVALAPEGRPDAAAVRFRDRLELPGGAVVLALGRAATGGDAAVWLPGPRLLLAGDLVGPVAAIGVETDTEAWIGVLERLERLAPSVVVPSRGEAGGLELLAGRREALSALRAAVWSDLVAGREPGAIVAGRSAADLPPGLVGHVVDELSGRLPPRELLEEAGLREGPSPSRQDPGWTPPTRVAWRNLWPDRLATLQAVAPGLEIVPFTTAEEAVAAVAGADALIGLLTPEVLAAGKDLRWAQVPSAGVEDEVAIPGLAERGIVLTNGQRLASPVIAEHGMALVRALARRLDRALEAQGRGRWERAGYRGDGDLLRLRGRTLLVVGLGGIGSEVARLAHGAGMTVLATRSRGLEGPEFVAEVALAEDLGRLLARADVVVNCLPLTPETRGLFDREAFRLMPDHALFVNLGRGGTVVTADLVAALEAGELGGAGLDVTDPEPLPDSHPLWSAPNLIVTPHSAAISDAGRERLWLLFRENLRRFAAGEFLLSVVDLERGY